MTWTTQPRSKGAGDLAYLKAGEGPPLVLIHGVGLRAEAWAAMMPTLGQAYTVYAVDMPGHGASALMGAQHLNDYVTRVAAFTEALGAPAVIAGHSMGAMITLDLAAQHPSIVNGAVALNAIYRRSPEAAQAVQARAADLAQNPSVSPEPTLARWFGDSPEGALADAAQACRSWLSGADPQGYAAAYTVFAHHDGPSDTQLQNLHVPALFMTGTDDPNSTPAMSEQMAARAPHGTARVIASTAHMMPMTHQDQVAQAILATFQPKLP